MIEGEKLGTFWGYTFGGIWQEDEVNAPFVDANGQTNGKTNGEVYKVVAGNSKYVDTNKDGVLNDADQGIMAVVNRHLTGVGTIASITRILISHSLW